MIALVEIEEVKNGKNKRINKDIKNKDITVDILEKIGRKMEREIGNGLHFDGADINKDMIFVDNNVKKAFKEMDKKDYDKVVRQIRKDDLTYLVDSEDSILEQLVDQDMEQIGEMINSSTWAVQNWLSDNYPGLNFYTEVFSMEPSFRIYFERDFSLSSFERSAVRSIKYVDKVVSDMVQLENRTDLPNEVVESIWCGNIDLIKKDSNARQIFHELLLRSKWFKIQDYRDIYPEEFAYSSHIYFTSK